MPLRVSVYNVLQKSNNAICFTDAGMAVVKNLLIICTYNGARFAKTNLSMMAIRIFELGSWPFFIAVLHN